MKLYLLDCRNLDIEQFQKYLSKARRRRMQVFRYEPEKTELGIDLLIQYVFGDNDYSYSNYDGHPVLTNHRYEISFSHSGNYALLGVSKYRFGVDIQKMTWYSPRVAKRFLSFATIKTKDDFFKAWTVLEANGKRTGYGILMDKKDIINTYSTKIGDYYLAATLDKNDALEEIIQLDIGDLLSSENFK